ncbi:hypothetical protein GGQ73_002929 [Rhizobium skierniewicense]|uniref:Uncharacterized protein n=1 Tax=Rhizobium skierniewicense TaxID=984260 RepID=A0A7W6CE88_9HYPH|nr:hypothetical protein [Rhizobium skierniewicense]
MESSYSPIDRGERRKAVESPLIASVFKAGVGSAHMRLLHNLSCKVMPTSMAITNRAV